MGATFHPLCNLRNCWFSLILINFIFGISGIVMCTLKLRHGQEEEVREDFFKLSVIFATCNLILSVLLLVSVIKNNQKYACICAFLSFLSLFVALVHIEGKNVTTSAISIATFVVVGVLFLFWFCLYSAYRIMYKEYKVTDDDDV